MFTKKIIVTNPSRSRTGLQGDTPFSPHQIEDGVYTASSYSEDGEKIYLRMERITKENNRAWCQYQNSAEQLVRESRGALVGFPLYIKKNEGNENYSIDLKATPVDSLLKMTGFNQEEYINFLDYLIKQGCINKSPKLKTLNACRAGMVANVMTTDHESYAIYASKNPDFSIKNITLSDTGEVNLKNFIHHYDDLIMSVGSDFSSSDDYENRGIFRNPLSIIDNKHKGISMILHGFTAAVAQKFFPEKKYMRVRPIGSMQAIISNSSLKRQDFHNDDESYDKIKAVTNCREEDSETATNSINTSALANLYYQSSAKMEERAISLDEQKVSDEVRMRF